MVRYAATVFALFWSRVSPFARCLPDVGQTRLLRTGPRRSPGPGSGGPISRSRRDARGGDPHQPQRRRKSLSPAGRLLHATDGPRESRGHIARRLKGLSCRAHPRARVGPAPVPGQGRQQRGRHLAGARSETAAARPSSQALLRAMGLPECARENLRGPGTGGAGAARAQ